MRPNRHRHSALRLAVVALAVAVLPARSPAQQAAGADVFDQFFRFGDTEHKVYAQEAPGETVDPFTGTLRLVHEDLVLPGKGGLDLHIVRTYSSKIWSRSDLLDVDPLLADNSQSVLGYGWTFHMGRLANPYADVPTLGCGAGEFPVFEAPGGESRVFFPVSGDAWHRRYRSKDHWLLELNCSVPLVGNATGACVWSSSGVRYELSTAVGNQFFDGTRPVLPVTAIVDPAGPRITVTYLPSTGAVASVTDSYARLVSFGYTSGDDGLRLETMTANGKVYSYGYTTYTSSETTGPGRQALRGDRRFLTEVRPPAGGVHRYEYGYASTVVRNQYALTKVTTRHGATTEYVYDSVPFFTGRETVAFPVVSRRITGGRGVPSGTWSYAYSSPPPLCGITRSCSKNPLDGADISQHVTTVTRPDGLHDTFVIIGFGYIVDHAPAGGLTYAVGLTMEAARADRAEVEWFGWRPDEVHAISPIPYAAPVYGGNCGAYQVNDPAVWAPLLHTRWIQRDGATFSTEYSDFDAYGQARSVVETGNQGALNSGNAPRVEPRAEIRTTSWTFFAAESETGVPLNMVRGRPLTQHVCVAGECLDNGWTYGGPGHRRDSETRSGVTTWFGHDPATGDLASVTNALGSTLQLSDYYYGVPRTIDLAGAYAVTREVSWEGWILGERSGRGHTTSYGWDAIGRPLSVTPPGNNLPTTYDYAPDGRPDGEAVRATKGTYWKLSSLDGLGRVVATSDSEGILSKTEYRDAMGTRVFRSYPYGGPDGAPVPVGDLIEHDGLGRPASVLKGHRPSEPSATCDADGVCAVWLHHEANATWTGVERTSTDVVGWWRGSTSYGDPGEARLTAVADPLGHIWRYAYTTAGNLASVSAPLAQGDRSFRYDANQFLRTETTAESGAVSFARNAIGQMTGRTDARGVTATYAHEDPLSRLTGIAWQTDDDVVRRYDRNTLERAGTLRGGAFVYGYDELDRLTSATWTYRGVVYGTAYGFDEMGCLETITYPTGTIVTATGCDGLNRPTGLSIQRPGGAAQAVVTGIQYHPSGQPAHYTYANGIRTDVGYDDHARLATLDARDRLSQNVAGLSYRYDGAGNVAAFDNSAEADAARTMGYDATDRLRWVYAPAQWGYTEYEYDALGNLTWKRRGSGGVDTEYVYDPSTNRLAYSTGPGPKALSLTWDAPGRLAASSDAATYVYDASGRRIQKTDPSGATVYHYDAAGRVIAETQPDGTKLRDYIYLGNKLVAVDGCVTVGPPAPCTERQWYHTDALGSVLARSDEGGNVVAQFDYEPWGERWNAPGLVAGVDGDRQYNGRVYDAGTGFHDYGARMYWPEIGRFVSADSYQGDPANPASLNRYSYVHNNPYKYVDPSGHNPLLVGALIALLFIENDQHANLAPVAAAVAPGPAAAVLNAAGAKSLADGNYQQAEQAFAGALLSAFVGKAGSGGGASLSSRAQEVHGVLDPIAQAQRTTAVMSTEEGLNIVAGGARDLTPAQRAALKAGEVAAKAPGQHAEVTALKHAEGAGLTPKSMATTRPICPNCTTAIEQSGGTVTSPTTAKW